MSPKRKNAVEVLKRRKAMIDALIKFMKKHPKITCDASVKGLEAALPGNWLSAWEMFCVPKYEPPSE